MFAKTQAEAPLPEPTSLVVLVDSRGIVAGVSTDSELVRGRMLPHLLADATAYLGVALNHAVQIGQPAASMPFIAHGTRVEFTGA